MTCWAIDLSDERDWSCERGGMLGAGGGGVGGEAGGDAALLTVEGGEHDDSGIELFSSGTGVDDCGPSL
jgi:hypothetical protein